MSYHRDCGGTVKLHAQHTNGQSYHYMRCTACQSVVHPSDALAERPEKVRQKTAGVKRRRPRFTIKSWKDVK